MKKAFMRGVCALNLEAMTMFQESDGKNGTAPTGSPYCIAMKYSE